MTQFVNQRVPDQIFGNEKQFGIQADGLAIRAASPPRSLSSHQDTIELEAAFVSQSLEPRLEVFVALADQPPP